MADYNHAPAHTVTLTAGTRLGRYEILAALGAGGMGEVYLASDTELGRKVAIKAIQSNVTSDRQARRLVMQEARAAAGLVHPGIAAIHDVIEVGGAPLIVMEYVAGESLDRRLRRESVSIPQATEWGMQIAEALQHAHANGIVHCDIKPGNIRVRPDSVIKVLDFGIARIRSVAAGGVGPGEAGETTTIVTPHIVGTPPYMAPEQVLSMPVDARTDVYAIGVVMFELLSGKRPFDAADRLTLSAQIVSGPTPLVADVNPTVPADLSAVVARAMARSAADRYETAAALAAALREVHARITRSSTADVDQPSPPPRTARRLGIAGAIAVAIALAAAGAFGIWHGRTAAPSPGATHGTPVVAVLPLRNLSNASENDYLSAGVTDVAISKLAALPGARVLSTGATSRYRDGADRAERAARDLGATLVVDGSLQRAGNRLLVTVNLLRAGSNAVAWSGTFSALVDDLFGLQRQLTEGLIGGLQQTGALSGALTAPDRARLAGGPTSDVDAFANYSQGRSFLQRPEVPGNLDRAISLLQAAIARDPKFALAHASLGEADWAQYQRTRDQAWLTKARDETLEALKLDPDQAAVRYSLALIYNGTGRAADAVDELQRAIALQPGADDPHRLLGEILAKRGDFDRAVRELQYAIDLRPSYWTNYYSLGIVFYNAGRYRDAIAPLTRVTELQPDSTRGFQALGTAYHQLGDLTNALANYRRTIQINPTAGAWANIGTIHFGRGEYGEAAAAYDHAIALDPVSPVARRNAGDAHEALGDKAKARAAYEKAVELAGRAVAVNPREPRTLALQALCEAKLGRAGDAQKHIAAAAEMAPDEKEVLYKEAAIRALGGDKTGALKALDAAVARGYSVTLVTADRDLRSLHGTMEYERLVHARQ
jgi:serine/threonine protein kinase/tetratricopeptide (TPR) repeat protein